LHQEMRWAGLVQIFHDPSAIGPLHFFNRNLLIFWADLWDYEIHRIFSDYENWVIPISVNFWCCYLSSDVACTTSRSL
jgi:hypothetical protein